MTGVNRGGGGGALSVNGFMILWAPSLFIGPPPPHKNWGGGGGGGTGVFFVPALKTSLPTD